MATLLARRGDDPVLVDIVLSGARGAESMVLERLLERSGVVTARSESGPTVAAALGERATAQLTRSRC